MKCDKMELLFADLLYNELNEEEKELALEHISTCKSCTGKYKNLRETSAALGRWKEEDAEMNLIFIEEKIPFFERLFGKLDLIGISPRQLVFGMITTLLLVVLFTGILRTEAIYRNGSWYISFGSSAKMENQMEESTLIADFKRLQQENLVFTNRLLLASEERIRNENIAVVNELANQFALLRRQDLTLIGRSINEMSQRSEGRYVRTNQLLDGLYRLSAYQPGGLSGTRSVEGK